MNCFFFFINILEINIVYRVYISCLLFCRFAAVYFFIARIVAEKKKKLESWKGNKGTQNRMFIYQSGFGENKKKKSKVCKTITKTPNKKTLFAFVNDLTKANLLCSIELVRLVGFRVLNLDWEGHNDARKKGSQWCNFHDNWLNECCLYISLTVFMSVCEMLCRYFTMTITWMESFSKFSFVTFTHPPTLPTQLLKKSSHLQQKKVYTTQYSISNKIHDISTMQNKICFTTKIST